jgi:hypothetical protein
MVARAVAKRSVCRAAINKRIAQRHKAPACAWRSEARLARQSSIEERSFTKIRKTSGLIENLRIGTFELATRLIYL